MNLATVGKSIKNKSVDIKGRFIPANIGTLIEKIYVSPKSSELFKAIIPSIFKKYDVSMELLQISELYSIKK